MTSKFPHFKKLELSDREEIEGYARNYDPYSDFNFIDLWSWDIAGKSEFAILNHNLVIKLSGYYSDSYSYSFLGNNMVNETIGLLFDQLEQEGNKIPELILVPEISIGGINANKYYLEIDLNSYDYIYNIQELVVYAGGKYSDKRRKLNSFLRNNPEAKVKIIDLNDPSFKLYIKNLNVTWTKNKSKNDPEFYLPKENIAIDRFLDANFNNLLSIGVFSGDALIGYSIFSQLHNDYAICHFSKADNSNIGVYEFLMRESAIILREKNAKLLNYQEDLGLPGLRFFKNSFKPSNFLKKYFIKKH